MRYLLLLCAVLLVCSPLCFAHPPSSIKAAAVMETSTVTVTVAHHVANPATHYIKLIRIKINGKTVAESTILQQTDTKEQVENLTVPGLKAGDKLLIQAYCSRFGSKGSTVTVE